MRKQVLVRQQVVVFIALVLASYPISSLLGLFINLAPIANILGFLSLLSYVFTLLPSLLKIVFPITKKSRFINWLLKHRRHLGVAAFSLGLNHGVLLLMERHVNFLDLQTYTKYYQGFSLLFIFTLLAVTSNDKTVKSLKSNWKKLHKLTYLLIFLLPWHILGQMSGGWTYLTPIGVVVTIFIAVLFIFRKSKEQLKLL